MARILVAEDETPLRELIRRGLQMKGHEVVTAVDGAAALDIVMADPRGFDLVLTDIRMPVMDGIALALALGAERPGQRILLMTGYADQRERAQGLEALVRDVILKPFTLDALAKAVEAALA